MQLPESLPARLYLLAVNPTRQRLTGQQELGYLLRAAALTDLQLRGLINDENGKVSVGTQLRLGDPVLDAMLAEIAGDKPRSWRAWVQRRHRAIRGEVREQLEGHRWIVTERRRFLGIFPTLSVTVLDQLAVERMRHRLVGVLDGGQVDRRDAALVALAAAAQLRAVLSGRQRRAYRQRLAELTAQAGPAAPALRKVIQQQRAAAASGG